MGTIWTSNFLVLVLYLFVLKYNANGERVKDKIYEVIQGAAPCFRRLNATHQIGCSSIFRGSTGVIHIVKNSSDINWLVSDATAGPYMIVLEPPLFTKEILNTFKQYPNQISGVILINGTIPANFSHDSKCPNNQFELSGTCDANEENQWNNIGTDLLREDIPYPIFFVSNMTYVEMIKNCADKFNNRTDQKSQSLCSLELKAFMYGAVNTVTCSRRNNLKSNLNVGGCEPLGDKNIWSTLFPRGNYSISKHSENITYTDDKNNGSIILIAARLDTTSMFDGISPGAISPISGLVTLLTCARMLKEMFNNGTNFYSDNVLFLIFNGESYDYIGSQRVVYDMQNGNFPVKQDKETKYQYPKIELKNIALFIELSQLSNKTSLFVHHVNYENPESNDTVDTTIKNLKTELLIHNITFTESKTGKIPPSSLQTFLKADNNTPGIVITDHLKNYRNQYYNSIFDNANNLNYTYYSSNDTIPHDSIQSFLSNVSFSVAKVVYERLTKSKYKKEIYDPVLVNDLIYCYLYSSNCTLFRKATYKENLQDKPLALYIGVVTWINALPTVTGFVLALLTGDNTKLTQKECHDMGIVPVFQYLWMSFDENNNSTGACIRTTMNFTEAVSPAFIIDDYDWESGKYSSWSESVWQEISMRMFLKPSAYHENITISLGTIVLIFSFLTVYFINLKADILFNICQNTVGTQC